ncbi:cytochrome C [Acidobacteria bacterium ACD]|nr:MAG: cytochrome C [Acidobacteriota bacterium]MCE7958642.1 cytochrome C [Acidobacteria bacterium ACB2]MDL1950638.1 cytochrome C [Acidobacteria bacterium ACD]
MAQIFPRSSNVLSRASVVVLLGAAGATLGGVMMMDRTGFNQRAGTTLEQPVPFSHEHHVQGLGIDCRYCHTAVERSSTAGLPPTATCMNCHKLVWNEAPMLEPVRSSFRTGQPLKWAKVHDLPDFVYFDHSIHVAKGIGCASCHGPVQEMRLMRSANAIQMRWCLDCHRNPERHLRPKEEVFSTTWKAKDQEALGRELRETYRIRPTELLTSCGTCHR